MKNQTKKSYILLIEGTTNDNNGDLKRGFNKLLSQKLSGKMPRIIMGDGKSMVIRKFKKLNKPNEKLLLIDLDKVESEKAKDLKKYQLELEKEFVFYMIQEMEAWFLSQPEILDAFYKTDISAKIPKKRPQAIKNPDRELIKYTKKTSKGAYHKVNHGTQLLELLDAEKLTQDFSEFAELIEKLAK